MNNHFRLVAQIYFIFFIISFVVSSVWEMSHAHLYQWLGPMELTIPHLLWFSVKDALLYLSFILLVALLARDLVWIKRPKAWHLLLVLAIGFVVSTVIESQAILAGRWAYLSTMPIIPFINVGLSPILQMTAGLLVTIWLTILLNRNLWAR